MKIVLFCEHQYAISILSPLQAEIDKTGEHEALWFVDARHIPDFPLREQVAWTNSIQDIYDYAPHAIFVPGNIVPYYLPGVKAEIFHGYAAEKKDHWVIRRYLDLYLTQGPFFTKKFQKLALKYKDFEVKETGWPRQDWIYQHLHAFEPYKNEILSRHNRKLLVLYAPTFSPSLTSLPYMKDALIRLSKERDVVVLLKFHPLTRKEWVDEYRQLTEVHDHLIWIDDHQITKYIMVCDLMISDTSSAVYEALLLDKPVITCNNVADEHYWLDIRDVNDLPEAFDKAQTAEYAQKRKWIIDNYDPHLDGKVAQRMLTAVADYISRHGIPKERKLNLWRKYQSIRKFGKIRR
ncbi:MAG: CDP-glycerol glycerophosphotransferase family protein [Dysgonamonadaceae bacterium]|jgi:CDP-glycerol glycerophosphotransferase (TagB/SpsB family)|nr:CDP-glycerol glycerophosphotransferase family protein [Dysgonamonadaceae bacterium]